MASVSSPNSSPRSRRTRKTTAPMPTARSADTAPAAGSEARKGTANPAVRVAVVYTPAPKNAPWPKLK